MLYKAKDSRECGNYRTIALISHCSKILLHIILKRMKNKVEAELAEEQAGFRQNRSTGDMLCALQVLLEKIIEDKLEAYIVFIDYSKAFDCVSHKGLFNIMINMGFPRHLVYLIKDLYTNQEAFIRWEGEHTEPFPIEKGVRQGCILSPHLFSLYTEQVMRENTDDEVGIVVGGRKFSNLRYADDTALCTKSFQETIDYLNAINEGGKAKNLKLNAAKTKYLKIGTSESNPILIENEELEEVEFMKYLGSLKTNDGDCTKDINARIGIAKRKMKELNCIWKDKSLGLPLKQKILKTLIWSIVSYGAEGWTLRKKNMKKLEATEMWFYRRLLRISWKEKRTNSSILQELNTKRELVSVIVKRKMTYFGHAMRHPKCHLMKDAITGKTTGKRGRGRPRTSYLKNISDWCKKSQAEVIHATEDREEWRSIVRRAARAASDHVEAD